MSDDLIPPDTERCQVEILEGSFMTFGPRSYKRCENVPVVIAQENQPGPDGKIGSMSLCASCLTEHDKRAPAGFATFYSVDEWRAK